MGKHIIIGAGKIGRGFIAQLLENRGEEFCFIENYEKLAQGLNQAGRYHIHVLGNEQRDSEIIGRKVYTYQDTKEIKEKVLDADCIFTSVGGKNLEGLCEVLGCAVRNRLEQGVAKPLNFITCENWKRPAEILRAGIGKYCGGYEEEYNKKFGFTEAVILRSGIENKEDWLAVNVQDYWELPVNAGKVVGKLPDMEGIVLMEDFDGFLERKFYTYNAANGTVAYIGTLMGYQKIAEGAHDSFILKILRGVYDETSKALCAKYNFPLEKQLEFTESSLQKMQNRIIEDTLERNARDPMRKLGAEDRLLGPALMAYRYGIIPENLAVSIAAAIHYENEQDESACELKKLREKEGVEGVLQKAGKLEKRHPLIKLVKEKEEFLIRERIII